MARLGTQTRRQAVILTDTPDQIYRDLCHRIEFVVARMSESERLSTMEVQTFRPFAAQWLRDFRYGQQQELLQRANAVNPQPTNESSEEPQRKRPKRSKKGPQA